MDTAQLVREESYTDQRIGSIRVLIPVLLDGQPDPERSKSYVGQTQVMTQAGPLPLSFELPGRSLADAIEGFPAAAEKAIEEAVEEIKRMQREQASSIMVPGQGGGGMGDLPGGNSGSMPGGGIKLR
ncbi:hypothetical protein G3I74_00935 [Wenzhouxiangella sp. C33]|uniref:Cytoplasmic protein n=2 Tax=Wenzhouxiangella limi TaxID=2707351 RepID=A0A845UZ00_9GAMM|nr:hypothetical protein [Wenzhouxiangella limi]